MLPPEPVLNWSAGFTGLTQMHELVKQQVIIKILVTILLWKHIILVGHFIIKFLEIRPLCIRFPVVHVTCITIVSKSGKQPL